MNEAEREENGWPEAKALVMDKLETIVEDHRLARTENTRAHERIIKEVNDRFHTAPCPDIIKMKEDSGEQKQRLDFLERRAEEDRESFREMVEKNEGQSQSRFRFGASIGIAIVSLLATLLAHNVWG